MSIPRMVCWWGPLSIRSQMMCRPDSSISAIGIHTARFLLRQAITMESCSTGRGLLFRSAQAAQPEPRLLERPGIWRSYRLHDDHGEVRIIYENDAQMA